MEVTAGSRIFSECKENLFADLALKPFNII
jgi:hypothetical protein